MSSQSFYWSFNHRRCRCDCVLQMLTQQKQKYLYKILLRLAVQGPTSSSHTIIYDFVNYLQEINTVIITSFHNHNQLTKQTSNKIFFAGQVEIQLNVHFLSNWMELQMVSKQVFLVIVFKCIYLCSMLNFQPYILTSQQNKPNMQKQSDLFSKIKLTEITHHLFIHHQKVDYLLLLSAKYQLKLYTFKNAFFQILSNYTISPVNPVSFSLGNHGEVYLLHSCGIMIWTVTQIISQCQPEKVKIQFASPPIKVLPLGKDNFIIICQQNAICMICSNGRQNFNCHSELALNQTLVDRTNDQVYALVPSSTNRFPYLFMGQQILLWNTSNFMESYIKYCQSYYYQDQILPKGKNVMCYSAEQQMVYIFLKEVLLILHAKKTNQKVAHVFHIRLKIKTKWGDSQLACSISNQTGRLAYIGKDRIGQIIPSQYRSLRKSIKQKMYYLNHNLMLLISHNNSSKMCKIYLHQCNQIN